MELVKALTDQEDAQDMSDTAGILTGIKGVDIKDSKLQQIGSSAFRCCDSLREITLPRGVSVNERAFKETPVRIDYYEY